MNDDANTEEVNDGRLTYRVCFIDKKSRISSVLKDNAELFGNVEKTMVITNKIIKKLLDKDLECKIPSCIKDNYTDIPISCGTISTVVIPEFKSLLYIIDQFDRMIEGSDDVPIIYVDYTNATPEQAVLISQMSLIFNIQPYIVKNDELKALMPIPRIIDLSEQQTEILIWKHDDEITYEYADIENELEISHTTSSRSMSILKDYGLIKEERWTRGCPHRFRTTENGIFMGRINGRMIDGKPHPNKSKKNRSPITGSLFRAGWYFQTIMHISIDIDVTKDDRSTDISEVVP